MAHDDHARPPSRNNRQLSPRHQHIISEKSPRQDIVSHAPVPVAEPVQPRTVLRNTIVGAFVASATTILFGDMITWLKDMVLALGKHISIRWMP